MEKLLYDGLIKITDDGRAFRLRKNGWHEVGADNGRNVYRTVHIPGGKSAMLHRLIAESFIPNPEGKPMVNHIDGHKNNNAVSNLEWVTGSENARHAIKTGLNGVSHRTHVCSVCGAPTTNFSNPFYAKHYVCNECRELQRRNRAMQRIDMSILNGLELDMVNDYAAGDSKQIIADRYGMTLHQVVNRFISIEKRSKNRKEALTIKNIPPDRNF